MDQQKTGALIAQRRKEQNLTQKQLAEKIGVSDRAISKWERGAGFPDVSLIEVLADALSLSVLELFRGEIQPTVSEEDAPARETLHFALPQMMGRIRRYKWLTVSLCSLLLLVTALFLIATAGNSWSHGNSPIPPSEATAIAPEILITAEDFQLIDVILSDPVLGNYYIPYPHGQDVTRCVLENEDAREFTDYFDCLGLELQYTGIYIHGSNLSIIYSTPTMSVYLTYGPKHIEKNVILSEVPIWDEDGVLIPLGRRHGKRIDLQNFNNEAFYRGGYVTGWLEHFRTTFY